MTHVAPRLIKGCRPRRGATQLVSPGVDGLRYLELSLLTLADGESHAVPADQRETVVYLLAGRASLASPDLPEAVSLGPRGDVFADGPWAAYFPPRVTVRVSAAGELQAAIIRAPSAGRGVPMVVTSSDVNPRRVGTDNWRRVVFNVIDATGRGGRLLVGETIQAAGGWSSYPPHKHDTRTAAGELAMEELYYYRMRPPGGFATQIVYTAPGDPDPIDVAYRVEAGDLVVIPRGYHPVAAAPGYQLFYLWAMAGEESRYGASSDDPVHVWVREQAMDERTRRDAH